MLSEADEYADPNAAGNRALAFIAMRSVKAITHTRSDSDLAELDPEGHLLAAVAHLRAWIYSEPLDLEHRDRVLSHA